MVGACVRAFIFAAFLARQRSLVMCGISLKKIFKCVCVKNEINDPPMFFLAAKLLDLPVKGDL
jgi:hypothetical protein